MKAFFLFLSYILRFCPEPLLHLVKRPPERLPPQQRLRRKKIPSAESLINQAFSFAINIQQTLAGVQDKESADNAVKTLQDIQKDIRHFLQLQDKLNDAEKEKEDALIEKNEKTNGNAGQPLQAGRQTPV